MCSDVWSGMCPSRLVATTSLDARKAPQHAPRCLAYRLLVGPVEGTRHTCPVPARPSHNSGLHVGVALFALGLVFIAVDVLPFFDGTRNTPLWLNLACLLAPAGFAVAVWSGLRRGRAEQRDAVRQLAADATPTDRELPRA